MIDIIMINGKKGSGKNHVALRMRDREQLAFADDIKQILANMFDLTLDEINELKNKKRTFTITGQSMRELLQRFGTEAMKPIFGENVWTYRVFKKMIESKNNKFVITDFRFKKEYETLKTLLDQYDIEYKITTVKIVLTDENKEEKDEHISENDLKGFEFDRVAYNDRRTLRVFAELEDLF